MYAIVLAGGFGTRLRPLTFVRPKHMLPIVDKPMLEHIVQYLVDSNLFDEIILSIGSKEEFQEIVNHFQNKDFGVKISFVKEEKRLGGVGAIKNVLDNFDIKEPFVLYLGDIITSFDLRYLIETHKKSSAIATLALKEDAEPWKYSSVVLDGIEIKKFVEKPPIGKEPSKLISAGIYVMSPEIRDHLGYEFLDSTGMIFPILLRKGLKLGGVSIGDSFWVDVGRPASYLEATAYILQKYGKDKWIDADVEIGEDTTFAGPVVIYKGTQIGKNCFIKNAVVLENNQIGDNCHIVNSIIDEGCKIGSEIHISTTLGRGSVLGEGKENQ